MAAVTVTCSDIIVKMSDVGFIWPVFFVIESFKLFAA